MSVQLHQMLQDLLAPTTGRQLESLLKMEQEWSEEAITRFAIFLSECDDSICVDLCPMLGRSKHARLIHTIAVFAKRDSAQLQKAAMQSLQLVPTATRVHELCSLLKSRHVWVRKTACQMMGSAGNDGRRPELLQKLRDEEKDVVIAALDAIKRLDFSEAAPSIDVLLKAERDNDILLAAISALQSILTTHLPTGTLVKVLLDTTLENQVRCAAAQALGKQADAHARDPLLSLLTSNEPRMIRSAAARALKTYKDGGVIREMIDIGCSTAEIGLKLVCIQSLRAMPPDGIQKICREFIQASDPRRRLEIVILMGELDISGAATFLLKHLKNEECIAVRAACVESIATLKGTAIRDFLIEQMDKEPTVAYTAIAAMTELLDETYVVEFVQRLAEIDNDVYWEAALSALSLRGRSSRLSPAIYPYLTQLFTCPHRHVAWLAADVVGWLKDKDSTKELVNSMLDVDDDNFKIVVTRTLRAIYRDDLLALVDGLTPDHLRPMEYLIQNSSDLGRDPALVIGRLAECARDGFAGSVAALRAAGTLDPDAFVAASEQIHVSALPELAKVWSGFSDEIRCAVPLHWDPWLNSTNRTLKENALEFIDHQTGQAHIQQLVAMALTESTVTLRQKARQAVRRVVQTESAAEATE